MSSRVGLSNPVPSSDDVTGDALLQYAYLRSKQTIVQVHALRVARERTSYPVVVFHFPKKSEGYPVIRAADKEIEFHWTLGKNHVQTIFDLRK
jgi:hypothetical protein